MGRRDAVTLETARLLVRPFRPGGLADLLDYLSMPEVYRFEPGEPIDEATARRMAEERSRGTSFQALELRATGLVVGHCSFFEVENGEPATRELGFIVSPRFQGHGYATEGGAALVAHAFEALGTHRVVANCHPDNIASWRTLERIGFVREGRLRSNVFFRRDAEGRPIWQDTLVYGLLDPGRDATTADG